MPKFRLFDRLVEVTLLKNALQQNSAFLSAIEADFAYKSERRNSDNIKYEFLFCSPIIPGASIFEYNLPWNPNQRVNINETQAEFEQRISLNETQATLEQWDQSFPPNKTYFITKACEEIADEASRERILTSHKNQPPILLTFLNEYFNDCHHRNSFVDIYIHLLDALITLPNIDELNHENYYYKNFPFVIWFLYHAPTYDGMTSEQTQRLQTLSRELYEKCIAVEGSGPWIKNTYAHPDTLRMLTKATQQPIPCPMQYSNLLHPLSEQPLQPLEYTLIQLHFSQRNRIPLSQEAEIMFQKAIAATLKQTLSSDTSSAIIHYLMNSRQMDSLKSTDAARLAALHMPLSEKDNCLHVLLTYINELLKNPIESRRGQLKNYWSCTLSQSNVHKLTHPNVYTACIKAIACLGNPEDCRLVFRETHNPKLAYEAYFAIQKLSERQCPNKPLMLDFLKKQSAVLFLLERLQQSELVRLRDCQVPDFEETTNKLQTELSALYTSLKPGELRGMITAVATHISTPETHAVFKLFLPPIQPLPSAPAVSQLPTEKQEEFLDCEEDQPAIAGPSSAPSTRPNLLDLDLEPASTTALMDKIQHRIDGTPEDQSETSKGRCLIL